MSKPQVTVIIAAYNQAHLLDRCIKSVLTQKLSEIEVFLVDDGSTDNTLDIFDRYAVSDERCIVLHQSRKGIGAARNFALRHAKGDYVFFLSPTDTIKQETLKECIGGISGHPLSVVVFNDEAGSLLLNSDDNISQNGRQNDLEFNRLGGKVWNKLFDKELIRNNHLQFQEAFNFDDASFVFSALALAKEIIEIHKPLVKHDQAAEYTLSDGSVYSIWNSYILAKNILFSKGFFERNEQSFLNAVLDNLFDVMENTASDRVYHDIRFLLRFYGERDFQFLSHPINYYYHPARIFTYSRMIMNVPVPDDLEHPTVSVVVPSLNSREYIRECIESIIAQSLANIEILCVDAGSNDGTIEVLQEYAELDQRIHIIHSDKRSYGYQINLGIRNAKGKYLAIVESDDYIDPNMYKEQVKIADDNNLDLLRADYQIFVGEKDNHQFIYKNIMKYEDYYGVVVDANVDLKVFGGYVVPWSGLYKLSFLKENDIWLNETPGAAYQDNGLWFQCFTLAHRIYFYHKPFYFLRRDNPNSSIYAKNKVFCMCDEYDFIEKNLRKNDQLINRYGPMCAYYRFVNYMGTLHRIADIFKPDFLHRFADDFRRLVKEGFLDEKMFDDFQWKTLRKIIHDPDQYYYNSCPMTYEFFRFLEPSCYRAALSRWYKDKTHEDLNLYEPNDFNGKIQWLKLYHHSYQKTRLTDKLAVRDWVQGKIGPQYLRPLLGSWNSFDEIDEKTLPDQFVLRASHGKGWGKIFYSKTLLKNEDVKNQFDTWMNENYALVDGLELQYAEIPHRLIAEKYIMELEDSPLNYNFVCFNGRPEFIWVDKRKGNQRPRLVFDLNWNLIKLHDVNDNLDFKPSKPQYLDKMKEIAANLCEDFPFVVISLYETKDGIYFHNLDFSPFSGIVKWASFSDSKAIGNLLELPLEAATLPEHSFNDMGVPPVPVTFTPNEDILRQLNKTVLDHPVSSVSAKEIQDMKNDNHHLRSENEKLIQERNYWHQEWTNVKSGYSFRIGRVITFIPRKVRGGRRCLREHGWGYTFRRTLWHLGLISKWHE